MRIAVHAHCHHCPRVAVSACEYLDGRFRHGVCGQPICPSHTVKLTDGTTYCPNHGDQGKQQKREMEEHGA